MKSIITKLSVSNLVIKKSIITSISQNIYNQKSFNQEIDYTRIDYTRNRLYKKSIILESIIPEIDNTKIEGKKIKLKTYMGLGFWDEAGTSCTLFSSNSMSWLVTRDIVKDWESKIEGLTEEELWSFVGCGSASFIMKY